MKKKERRVTVYTHEMFWCWKDGKSMGWKEGMCGDENMERKKKLIFTERMWVDWDVWWLWIYCEYWFFHFQLFMYKYTEERKIEFQQSTKLYEQEMDLKEKVLKTIGYSLCIPLHLIHWVGLLKGSKMIYD